MRRLYLVAVVFAFACGAPPTGVEAELAGSDAVLMAKKGPKSGPTSRGRTSKPAPPDDSICMSSAEGGEVQCALQTSLPVAY